MKRMRERDVYVPNRSDPFNFTSNNSGNISITLKKPLENGDEIEIFGSETGTGFDSLYFKATYVKMPYDEISYEPTFFVQSFRYYVNEGSFDAAFMRIVDVTAAYNYDETDQNSIPKIVITALPTKQGEQAGFDSNLQGHAAIVISKTGLEAFKGHVS